MSAIILSCLKVFFCRILDVTMGTVRTMLTVKGNKVFASIMGFCEVFIWYVVVKDAMTAEGPVLPIAIAYAGGFATGTFIGSFLSGKLIKGKVIVQVITSDCSKSLLDAIRDDGFAITVVDVAASEYGGAKYMILANIENSQLDHFQSFVRERDPKAFIFVQESKSSIGGYTRTAK